jgi:dimethylamine/trimethylamine dehydrogenase
VVLAEAGDHLGGRVAREARLPGLATWIRVVDYREGQLRKLTNVELAFNSQLTAEEIVSYGFDHVAIATGAGWRRDGSGRWHTAAVDFGDLPLLTPDDLMDGVRPDGERVVIYDDDHYYMGGVLAELLVREGRRVTLVTPAARVSEWTVNTMEQDRIQRRLLELNVEIRTTHTVVGGGAGEVLVGCRYTEREQPVGCDALVLVTARDPRDSLVTELRQTATGIVRAIGDAWCPATIAAAVWDGHRYAEQLEQQDDREVPFLREVVKLADRPAEASA